MRKKGSAGDISTALGVQIPPPAPTLENYEQFILRRFEVPLFAAALIEGVDIDVYGDVYG
jgi:hypothetical protein